MKLSARRATNLIAAALATALLVPPLAGCENVIGYRDVDPTIDLGDWAEWDFEISGPPHAELGYYVEQLYEPIEEDGECWVVHGLQGGTWTMPALRTTGIGPFTTVTCTIVAETGEILGEVDAPTRFFLATDGFLEVQSLPIPVVHAPPNEADDIDDLFGLSAELACTVDDGDGRADSVSLRVILEEG